MRPLIMLVEDNERNIAARRVGFEQRDCSVLAVSNANDAIRELAAEHLVSLVVTDINLRPDDDDISGVALARYLRATGRDIPVAGYSAHFAEESTAVPEPVRRELFDYYYPRSKLRAREIAAVFDELAQVAREHLRRKSEELQQVLSLRIGQATIDGEDFATYRALVTSDRGLTEQIQTFRDPDLRFIGPEDQPELQRSLYLIIRTSGSLIEVEVLGMPALYAVAASEELAIVQLLELMQGFRDDLSSFSDIGHTARQLSTFLESVLR